MKMTYLDKRNNGKEVSENNTMAENIINIQSVQLSVSTLLLNINFML